MPAVAVPDRARDGLTGASAEIICETKATPDMRRGGFSFIVSTAKTEKRNSQTRENTPDRSGGLSADLHGSRRRQRKKRGFALDKQKRTSYNVKMIFKFKFNVDSPQDRGRVCERPKAKGTQTVVHQVKHNRMIAAVLLACFLSAVTLSGLFVATHLQHHCTGDGCVVCARIDACLHTVTTLTSGAVGVGAVVAVMLLRRTLVPVAAESVFTPAASLLTLKIRLNN